RFLGRGLPDVLLLDVAVAADRLGNARDFREQGNLLRLQPTRALVDHREIILDQRPLGPALDGAPERIERGASQEFQFGQPAERASIQPPYSFFISRPLLSRLAKIGGAR